MVQDVLFVKADELAHEVYRITRNFPKEELFGITSQLRRAALSVILNITEGFARCGDAEFQRFLKIAYGSLKETKYILNFCLQEKLITEEDYQKVGELSEEVGKILWGRMHSETKNKQ